MIGVSRLYRQLACSVLFLLLTCIKVNSVYAQGLINTEDTKSAVLTEHEQMLQSALNGSASAQFETGLLFEYGRGVVQDDSIAAYWYEKSAAQGNNEAQYRLAVFYDNGWGKQQDKKGALELYMSAAENGNEMAQHDLGIMYFQGAGTPKSLLQAYKWMKIAVLSGNPLMDKHLSLIAMEMSTDEIEVAEYLAIEWIESSVW